MQACVTLFTKLNLRCSICFDFVERRKFNDELVRHCCRFFGNKVERCFDIVAGVDGAFSDNEVGLPQERVPITCVPSGRSSSCCDDSLHVDAAAEYKMFGDHQRKQLISQEMKRSFDLVLVQPSPSFTHFLRRCPLFADVPIQSMAVDSSYFGP